MAPLSMAVVTASGALAPMGALNESSTSPTTFFYQLGAFGAAVVIAWWLLGRSDRAITEERTENQKEIVRMQILLAAETEAHQITRDRLYKALEHHP